MIKNLVYILSICIIVFLCQCKPEPEPEKDITNYVTLAEDEAFSMWVYNDIIQLVYTAQKYIYDSLYPEEVIVDTIFQDEIEPCYIISTNFDINSWPKTVYISFKDSCKELNQIIRTDSIIYTTSGLYANEDSLLTINLKNYTVNNISIEGDIIIKKIADSTTAYLSISLNNGKISALDSIVITREFDDLHYIWQGKGDTTTTFNDDIFQVAGSYSGTHSTTETNYTNEIIDTLEFRMDCPFIQTGVTNLEFTNNSLLELDFGNLNCDNLGRIYIDDVSKEFITDYIIYRDTTLSNK